MLQQRVSVEILLIDDASTDDTKERMKRFQKREEVCYIKNKKREGVSQARNRGILKAKGICSFLCLYLPFSFIFYLAVETGGAVPKAKIIYPYFFAVSSFSFISTSPAPFFPLPLETGEGNIFRYFVPYFSPRQSFGQKKEGTKENAKLYQKLKQINTFYIGFFFSNL